MSEAVLVISKYTNKVVAKTPGVTVEIALQAADELIMEMGLRRSDYRFEPANPDAPARVDTEALLREALGILMGCPVVRHHMEDDHEEWDRLKQILEEVGYGQK